VSRLGLPSEDHSIFDKRTIEDIYEEVREVYISSSVPWVVGYSGGKDSTATLQLIWYALSKLPSDKMQMPVYVIASDTLVETPLIVDRIHTSLQLINQTAKEKGLPFKAHKVIPETTDTFWVNLIGRGYPAPSQKFRWCTERMKIAPANRFILDRAEEFGEVVMILGARKTESSSRAQVMSSEQHKKISGSQLRRHHVLTRARVYTPIEDFTTDDVWSYLFQVQSPWGDNNRDLAALYQSAQAGECPLVVDTTTPSCGNSRFGCWTCTVVKRDKSMEAMIDSGEDWMLPMLELRDWLSDTQDPEKKLEFRDFKRRDGHVIVKDGRFIPGPYKKSAEDGERMGVRAYLLKRLLEVQEAVRTEGPDPNMELITESELHEIRRIWRTEEDPDWGDLVPQIFEEVTGRTLEWLQDDTGTFSVHEYRVLDAICKENDIPTGLVTRLLEQERQMQGMHRRAGIFQHLNNILGQEWRDEETIRQKKGVK
jgi:DNA sulfur modification protein DndC